MKIASPGGTARERFLAMRGAQAGSGGGWVAPDDDFEPSYLGWEIARCAAGLSSGDQRALGALAAALLVAVRGGSTRLPLDEGRLGAALTAVGAAEAAPVVAAILARAGAGDAGEPAASLVGRPGERKPLIVDGAWIYPERMHALESSFCARVRARLTRAGPTLETRTLTRVLAAVAGRPPPLTEDQKGAVREALREPIALITGGPGTGKTTIVVALLRALAWTGERMDAVAIVAPTGKAAQRLREAIDAGLAAASGDIADVGLGALAPTPQTLHRLLGWSPASGRFARHENDPLPHRLVIVDEASMVDLFMMDRLFRALSSEARVVLLGDAGQLPSVDAGAVFRDLCEGLKTVKLETNLRVRSDAGGKRIVAAAQSVNAGALDARFAESVVTRRTVTDVAFEGVEHLARPWADVADELLERWWRVRVSALEGFEARIARTYTTKGGALADDEGKDLRALFEHHARARILCVTRTRAIATSAQSINDQLCLRLRNTAASPLAYRRGAPRFSPGTPVMAEKNDYERQLYNGDQGVIARVDFGQGAGPELAAVFAQATALQAFSLDSLGELSPSFAMTVHKAQGSEFDDVAVVLPDTDLPLLSRELLYTAMTRARRSVLIIGSPDLLARAVSRGIERHTGVADQLRKQVH